MQIKYLVMDVDGTLTDGKIYMGSEGELCKAFDIKDGCGIHDLLIPSGIIPIIITGRSSKILENRCRELGISELFQGINDKVEKLEEILEKSCLGYQNVAYIGDDINDLDCMRSVKSAGGLVGCPADAAEAVLKVADYISARDGGNGAVREFIEWILKFGLKTAPVCGTYHQIVEPLYNIPHKAVEVNAEGHLIVDKDIDPDRYNWAVNG